MTTAATERRSAIEVIDRTCPRCGAMRALDQSYCLECGSALPITIGRLPGLRRRWVRRFGWYPGDWLWAGLLLLVVAVGGAVAAIVVSNHRHPGHGRVTFATANVAAAVPSGVPAAIAPRANTATLPTPPEPRSGATPKQRASRNGRIAWPAKRSGWTIVLGSFPKTTGQAEALQIAAQAAKNGLPEVGLLDSSSYPSLQPGYVVVFSGIYRSQSDAEAAVATVHQSGFRGAYSRQIAR